MTIPNAGDDLAGRVAALSSDSQKLASEVEALRLANEQTRRRADAADTKAGRGVLLALGLLAVVVLLVFVAADNRQVSARLDELTNQNLCQLYSLIIGGYNPETREPGVQRDQYEQAFQTMRALRAQLHCTSPDVPPRKDG